MRRRAFPVSRAAEALGPRARLDHLPGPHRPPLGRPGPGSQLGVGRYVPRRAAYRRCPVPVVLNCALLGGASRITGDDLFSAPQVSQHRPGTSRWIWKYGARTPRTESANCLSPPTTPAAGRTRSPSYTTSGWHRHLTQRQSRQAGCGQGRSGYLRVLTLPRRGLLDRHSASNPDQLVDRQAAALPVHRLVEMPAIVSPTPCRGPGQNRMCSPSPAAASSGGGLSGPRRRAAASIWPI
jgi:hypothetical protein